MTCTVIGHFQYLSSLGPCSVTYECLVYCSYTLKYKIINVMNLLGRVGLFYLQKVHFLFTGFDGPIFQVVLSIFTQVLVIGITKMDIRLLSEWPMTVFVSRRLKCNTYLLDNETF